jgi:hypothetical protein
MSIPRNPNLSVDKVGVFTELAADDFISVTADSASNVTVTVDAAGSNLPGVSYTSFQDAINFFQNKTLSNCVIDVAAGTYSMSSALLIKNLNKGGNPEDLKIRGDYQRDMAGYTFLDSVLASNNRHDYTSTVFGTKGATIALSGTSGSPTISITPSSGAIDLITAGVVAGDIFEVKYNSITTIVPLIVLSVTTDTITFTTDLTSNVSDLGTTVTLWPNRVLMVTGGDDIVDIFSNCTLDGFTFNGENGVTYGIVLFECAIGLNHTVFTQSNISSICASINASIPQKSIIGSMTYIDSTIHVHTSLVELRGAQLTNSYISVTSGLNVLTDVTISNECNIHSNKDGTIDILRMYSQSNSKRFKAFNTGKIHTNSLFLDDVTGIAVMSLSDSDVTLESFHITNSTDTHLLVQAGGSINIIGNCTATVYGIDYWNIGSGGTLTFDYKATKTLMISGATGFSDGGAVLSGNSITLTLTGIVVPIYTANANANQAFSLKPFDLKTGVNIVFSEVFSNLVLINDTGTEAFECGIGTAIAVAGALTGSMEDILVGLAQDFALSPGTNSQRVVMKTEGQLVSGGDSVYINFGTTAGAGFDGHTFSATGSIILKGYLV